MPGRAADRPPDDKTLLVHPLVARDGELALGALGDLIGDRMRILIGELQDDPLAAIEKFPGRIEVPGVAGRFLHDMQHDVPEIGKVHTPLLPALIRLTRRHAERGAGDHSVRMLNLIPDM